MRLSRYLLLLIALPLASARGEGATPDIDPWEPMNRNIFAFNETLDKYALRPVAKGYRFVMPDPAERGVSNFITNIYEFNSFFNSLLQGRGENALVSGGRFLINSSFGLFGLFDVATPMGIEHSPADFGQTLSVWGFEQGPYLMLPIIGPRTVRSGVGYVVDTYASIPSLIDNPEIAYSFWTVEAIDIRANLLKADELVFGDRYIFIRNAYLQRRATFLNGGIVEDTFSDYGDEADYEEF
ncbi:MAG: VacJ family lipoprotein [Halioglobus sp.]|nr:VacJ family lipoprotein [Halioglobus sp.]